MSDGQHQNWSRRKRWYLTYFAGLLGFNALVVSTELERCTSTSNDMFQHFCFFRAFWHCYPTDGSVQPLRRSSCVDNLTFCSRVLRWTAFLGPTVRAGRPTLHWKTIFLHKLLVRQKVDIPCHLSGIHCKQGSLSNHEDIDACDALVFPSWMCTIEKHSIHHYISFARRSVRCCAVNQQRVRVQFVDLTFLD